MLFGGRLLDGANRDKLKVHDLLVLSYHYIFFFIRLQKLFVHYFELDFLEISANVTFQIGTVVFYQIFEVFLVIIIAFVQITLKSENTITGEAATKLFILETWSIIGSFGLGFLLWSAFGVGFCVGIGKTLLLL